MLLKVGLEEKKKHDECDNSIIRAQGNLSYNVSPKCLFQIYAVPSQWNFYEETSSARSDCVSPVPFLQMQGRLQLQGTSFHLPSSREIITTQSSPPAKKLSGWFSRQFSYTCYSRETQISTGQRTHHDWTDFGEISLRLRGKMQVSKHATRYKTRKPKLGLKVAIIHDKTSQ